MMKSILLTAILSGIATTGNGFSVTKMLSVSPIQIELNEFDLERDTQVECLARNIYFESRGESAAGQMAVGQVTINRAKAESFPDSICGVVHQKNQFSWLWDKQSDKITQPEVYEKIEGMAGLLYDDYYTDARLPDIVNGATYFHSRWVNPKWFGMKVVARIDNHVFLRKL